MANAKNTNSPATVKASAKGRKAAQSISLDLSRRALLASNRKSGKGGGYLGKRNDEETNQALVQAFEAAGLNPNNPKHALDCALVSFAAAAGAGNLKMILVPQDDGTFTQGAKPMPPLSYKGALPAGAAVAALPPCGAFSGGLAIIAKHPTKGGFTYWRMVKGELSPCAVIYEGKAVTEAQEKADLAKVPLESVLLHMHLQDSRNGGAALAYAMGQMKEGGK